MQYKKKMKKKYRMKRNNNNQSIFKIKAPITTMSLPQKSKIMNLNQFSMLNKNTVLNATWNSP